MTHVRTKAFGWYRPAVLAGVACMLAACQTDMGLFNNDMPPSYQARHPIELETQTNSVTLPISIVDGKLDPMRRREATSFARDFRTDGEGAMAINIPVGASNEKEAALAARDIRDIMIKTGVPEKAVVYRPYKAGPGAVAPPVLLSYKRVHGVVHSECGVVDNLDIDYRNLQWQNYGCASQSNLAAMMANPNDLVSPRPLDSPNPERSVNIVKQYNQGSGGSSGAAAGSGSSGSSSSSGASK